MDKAILVEDVWKKFRRGERLDTLRDFIPSLFNWNKRKTGLAQDEFWALKGVSFEVKKGQTLGIIGHNGAGKSTLLKILTRILYPDKGRIKVWGRVSALIEITAGFHPELTGRENIYLNAAILGMKRKEVDKKLESIIEFSELREFIDTPVKRYSSGMYSRLGFSVAAHMDPEILLVDEVLSVGDIAFQAKCRRKMMEMAKSGITVVYISHNLPSVVELCERVILLEKGIIKEDGDANEVVRHYYESYSSYKVKEEYKGWVELQEVKIWDSMKQERRVYKSGEKVSIKFKFVPQRDINDLVNKITVKRADGMVVYATDSFRVNGKRFSLNKGKIVEIKIDLSLNLPEGNYFVDTELFIPFKGSVFFGQDVLGFSITSAPCDGYAYLNANWYE